LWLHCLINEAQFIATMASTRGADKETSLPLQKRRAAARAARYS
jgi:hypothetical protein